MSDWEYAEHFKVLKQEGMKRRASNRERAAERLKGLCIDFQSKNYGAHLIVDGLKGPIDFWPGTGRWKERATGEYGRGVKGVIKRAKVTA